MAILLIFVLALNRFCVLIAERMERVLFTGWEYVILPSASFIVAVGMTAMVILSCDVDRIYVEWLGFVDSVGNAQLYAISGRCFLIFPVLSLVLHIVIYSWMRKKHSSSRISSVVDGAEKQMCLQVTLLALSELLFIASFAILNVFLTQKSDFYFVISLYNILSTTPELLIPTFVLFGTKKMLHFFYRSSNKRAVLKVRFRKKGTDTT
ncbi:unnamed protein product [Cylicocyclus nassatus]|uniref:Serpentine receptor class gamma n=1 Tax=Cylicocyclus nassatus TaxID=53992 RepID=A0AA36GRA2_CYLNA|nr:unnamed protein product [Cylicocyclus nassatus]